MVKRVVLEACSIVRVQTWDSAAHVPLAVEEALGVRWPGSTGGVARGLAEVIGVGPADWLVLGALSGRESWLRQLDAAFEGTSFRSTDVSQALVRIEVDGAEARDLLAKGCGVDLHPAEFGVGRSARMRLAGMPVVVHCTAASRFECIVTASYADYLWAWMGDAGVEFAGTGGSGVY